MKLIARNSGPKYGSESGFLTPGKEYEVMCISTFRDWPDMSHMLKLNYNPIKASFFVHVITNRGIEETIWNDYFLSTEEMRQIKIEKIIN